MATIPAVIMRGGTSKGVFFHERDLPDDPAVRERVILAAFGSPDPYGRQIDGLGGATSTTSKVAIIAPHSGDADISYTFGQVGIDRPLVDGRGNCGNISSAVGPFAVDEGLVPVREGITEVCFLNTNTKKRIVAHVPVEGGRFAHEGEFAIPGIPGTASRIQLDYLDPGGAVTGRLLPTGNVTDTLDVPGVGPITVSIVDAANPLVFCLFSDLGLTGREQPADIDADAGLLRRLEAVRAQASVAAGIAGTAREASSDVPSVPKLAMVSPPSEYVRLDGSVADPDGIDLVAKMMSMGMAHRAYPLTGAICTTVAAGIPGTVVADALRAARDDGAVRLGHPSGTMSLAASLRQDGAGDWTVDKVSADRTARRLMEGVVHVPDSVLAG